MEDDIMKNTVITWIALLLAGLSVPASARIMEELGLDAGRRGDNRILSPVVDAEGVPPIP
jgi:hypothetical protein